MDTSTVLPAPETDRIKLPLTFDVEKMKQEIEALQLKDYMYYDAMPFRAPAHIVDPSLPHPPPAGDYADGSWTDWLDTKALKSTPYFMSIVDSFRKHTKVTLVRLLRLAPDSVIQEHTDPTLGLQIPRSVIRLTIPIATNDGVTFFLNDEPVLMNPGECWYLRLTDKHRVVNSGATDRINMTIDMIPNEWLRALVDEALNVSAA